MKKTIILIFAALLIFAFKGKNNEPSEKFNPPSAYCMLRCYPKYISCLSLGGSIEMCQQELNTCLELCEIAYPGE